MGVSRRRRLTTEAALEEIEGERGRVFEAALCCLADEIFFVNDGDQGSPSCVKQECSRVIYFLGKLGRWRLPYDVMVPWESSFILLLSTTKRKTDAGGRGRRTSRHKDDNKNKTARNLNDSLNVSLNIDYRFLMTN